jgi:hypothetical protein
VNNTFPLHHANRGNATINFATGAVATPSYVRFDSDNVQVEWVYDPPSQSVRFIVTVQKLAWLVPVVLWCCGAVCAGRVGRVGV